MTEHIFVERNARHSLTRPADLGLLFGGGRKGERKGGREREREREGGRGREGEGEREGKRERERERGREREGERCACEKGCAQGKETCVCARVKRGVH